MKKFFISICIFFCTIISSNVMASSRLMVNGHYLSYWSGMRIAHLGDSHVAGRSFPNAVRKQLNTSSYRIFAKNGVTINWFNSNSVYNNVKAYKPDMIILSIGTNDAAGRVSLSNMTKRLRKFASKYSKITNNILFTTPSGFYYKGNRHPYTDVVITAITIFGSFNGYPVWTLNEMHDLSWWKSHGYMAKDGIHFTHKGYTIMGSQLGHDIRTFGFGYKDVE